MFVPFFCPLGVAFLQIFVHDASDVQPAVTVCCHLLQRISEINDWVMHCRNLPDVAVAPCLPVA